MNVCNEKGIECDMATGLGFCSVTGCRKHNIITNISIIPTVTVTDVPTVEYAPVVRCKDCKYGITGHGIEDGFVLCSKPYVERGNAMHRCDWFCGDGKRKEQNDELGMDENILRKK